jgi:stringent starvation protein B
VSAIYARENGHGMAFELVSGSEHEAGGEPESAIDAADDTAEASPAQEASTEPAKAGLRSHLKLVK